MALTAVRDAARVIKHAGRVADAGTASISEMSKLSKQVASAYQTLLQAQVLDNLSPVLPFLLKLRGKPMSMRNHFAMEPMLSLRLPRRVLFKTGRQVSKSTGIGVRITAVHSARPYFNTMYIAPRFEQTKTFSNDRVAPLIADSPMFHSDVAVEQSILRRQFPVTQAMAYFTYAFLDCERTRGYSADSTIFDEIQDLRYDFIDVINQVLSASPFKQEIYTGTPKTKDNTISRLWEDTSQSEWVIPCSCSKKFNICSANHDLLKMIQRKGPSCAGCGRLLDPETGHYEHGKPDKAGEFLGIHAPKIIFPMHYRPNADTGGMEDWLKIYNRVANATNPSVLFNEDLGEDYDLRVNLLTESDLKAASVLNFSNDLDAAVARRNMYQEVYLGIDWGGGGVDGVSLTAVAVIGMRLDGRFDVLFMKKCDPTVGSFNEAALLTHIFDKLRPTRVPYDLSAGAGLQRELFLVHMGVPQEKLMPCNYASASAARDLVVPRTDGDGGRTYMSVDKARAIQHVCNAVRYGLVRFPQWETWKEYAKDFLALVEDKHSNVRGSDVYLIDTKAGQSDDIVHAIVFAATMGWHENGYPDWDTVVDSILAAKLRRPLLTEEQEKELRPNPANLADWTAQDERKK